jgi:hypothetical protein
MQYHNEDIFFAYYTGGTRGGTLTETLREIISKPEIHFSCSKHRQFGLKFEDVYFKNCYYSKWIKMESKHCQKNAEILLLFANQLHFDVVCPTKFSFDVKVISTIGNYYYEIMDDAWIKDFWTAANNQNFTDVEIYVGTVKLMDAHRVLLSARSPVLNEAFKKTNDTGKSVLTFDAEFDVAVVKNFLQFLYTGSLETSASKSTSHKQLLKLATMYEVETLKNMCQLANQVPDVEELTNCLLQL